jgi:SAM-dependent methyltransferase
VVDRQFADTGLASLYDLFHPWSRRKDFAFYLPWVMSARSVLDVGCGTGLLLHRAREAGHTGRLCGLDPGAGMLAQARKRLDIEWVQGELGGMVWEREFDLVVMTGHAFQVFVADDELRSALAAVGSALTEDGRFVFETRNPLARAWERWTPDNVVEVTDDTGVNVRMWHDVEQPVTGEIVRFTTTFASADRDAPRRSRSTLRFLDAARVTSFLSAAGLAVEEQLGDWDARPLSAASPEIITVARRALLAENRS